MFCGQCGKEIEEGSRFCKFCGQPVILAQKNRPAAPEGPAPNAEYTDQTEQYAGGGRPGGEGTLKYGDRTGYTEQYTGRGRPGREGTLEYGDRTGYTEQYTGGGQIPAGDPPMSGRRDYTRNFTSQNGPGPSPERFRKTAFRIDRRIRGRIIFPRPVCGKHKRKRTLIP